MAAISISHLYGAPAAQAPFAVSRSYSTDEELAAGCRACVPAAQQAFYKKYAGLMMAVCRRYAKDRMQAEDNLQKAFVRAFEKFAQYKGGSLRSWLQSIVIRECINDYHYNKRRPIEWLGEETGENLAMAPASALEELSLQELHDMIDQLPEGAKLVFNMYAIEGYTHPEIGQLLGISEGTSKSQFSRARRLLQQRIEATDTIHTLAR